MNIVKCTLLVTLLAAIVYAVQIETVTCYSHVTNTVEQSGEAGKIVFYATGRNLDVYSEHGDVALLVPTVTNSTVWASTNVLGATWASYNKFAEAVTNSGGRVKTYLNIFSPNEVQVLRLLSVGVKTNTVKMLIY